MPPDPFYLSPAWKTLRLKILRAAGWRCAMCGAARRHGTQVDHIIPRRKRPDLALDPRNLQVLCPSCHSSAKRCHELQGTPERGLDGYPLNSEWSRG